MKLSWTRKSEQTKSNTQQQDAAREALFSKEIADDLMSQINGGAGKSSCHTVLA
jgi:hypothetical protein